MTLGIYLITNIVDNKVYVGSSINIEERWKVHVSELNNNTKGICNDFLQNAWNKYGQSSFNFKIIEQCSEDKLIERENYWIKFYDSMNRSKGYNLKEAGRAGKLSDESRKKISKSKTGTKMSEDQRLKLKKIHKERNSKLTFEERKSKYGKIGDKNGMAKLTDEQMLEIWRQKLSARQIMDQYSMSYAHSYRIAGKRTRKYLLDQL